MWLLWTLHSVFHTTPAEGPFSAFAMKPVFFRRTSHLVRYPSGITAGTWSSLCVFAGFAVRSAHGARLFLQSCVRPERSPCARVPSVERRRTVPCTYLVSPTYGFFVPMYSMAQSRNSKLLLSVGTQSGVGKGGSGLSYAFHSTGVAGSFGPHAYRTPYTMVSIKKKIHIFGRDRTQP